MSKERPSSSEVRMLCRRLNVSSDDDVLKAMHYLEDYPAGHPVYEAAVDLIVALRDGDRCPTCGWLTGAP